MGQTIGENEPGRSFVDKLLRDKQEGDLEEASYKAMEDFRAKNKQNDHLHPWVAYREGYLDCAKHMQPKIAELERKLKVAVNVLERYKRAAFNIKGEVFSVGKIAAEALEKIGEVKE